MAPPLGFGGSEYQMQWLSNAGIITEHEMLAGNEK